MREFIEAAWVPGAVGQMETAIAEWNEATAERHRRSKAGPVPADQLVRIAWGFPDADEEALHEADVSSGWDLAGWVTQPGLLETPGGDIVVDATADTPEPKAPVHYCLEARLPRYPRGLPATPAQVREVERICRLYAYVIPTTEDDSGEGPERVLGVHALVPADGLTGAVLEDVCSRLTKVFCWVEEFLRGM
jgi:hypothetical protein